MVNPATSPARIPAADPGRQLAEDGQHVNEAVQRVIQHGQYLFGPECDAFESEFADRLGASGSVGVGSGTDAIEIALRTSGVGSGDEVVLPALTSSATAAAVLRAGAVPCFADVCPETMTLSPDSVRNAIGERTRAILPVHLYGHPCDMDRLCAIAAEAGVVLIEDCAQAHGATWRGRSVGTFGDGGAFSFYPTKNLGALGDAGALVSTDPDWLERARLIRQYGWRDRQVSAEAGVNSRMDEIQAAVLRIRLRSLERRNTRRIEIAEQYRSACIDSGLMCPVQSPEARHVYHQFVVRTERRASLQGHLSREGIDAAILYPNPLHLQPAFSGLPRISSLRAAEESTEQLLCLPVFPDLTEEEVARVCSALAAFSRTK